MNKKNVIKPDRNQNFSKWYQNVIKNSELADQSPVKGCMTIKPWGYSLWENITKCLNQMFKKTGIKNAYFPLLIPLNFMEKEAEHIKGFAKECAIVTHHTLNQNIKGKLIPKNSLPEPFIIRPTSETIIGDSFSKWITSYRDLPILINQWANVIRWEMRTRLFLRTNEFLWQEGHTAHYSFKEAKNRTKLMLNIYEKLSSRYLAIPVIKGEKSENERFPGAINTFSIEAMMQDNKALQSGTSHFLGQNFSKASNISFQTQNKTEELAWTTSWGVSSRLIGAIVMSHGDDNGIVLPPRITSAHIVILPIFKNTIEKRNTIKFAKNLLNKLKIITYFNRNIETIVDDRNIGGSRGWEWLKKGVPIRIEIGPKDIANNIVHIKRRDLCNNFSFKINANQFINKILCILNNIHNNMYQKSKQFMKKNTLKINSIKKFYNFFTPKNKIKPEIHGGFAISYWCGRSKCEKKIKKDLSVTIRCLPFYKKSNGNCIICKENNSKIAIFSKAY